MKYGCGEEDLAMRRVRLAGVGMAMVLGASWAVASAQTPPAAQEMGAAQGQAMPGPTLTLRQAVDRALGGSPEAEAAGADVSAAKAGVSLAQTGWMPRLNFVEDMSRGNDPVYVFGTRLRQQQFTQNDFSLNSLNTPTPVGNFATRFSGSWMLFNWMGTQDQIKGARFAAGSAAAMSEQVQQGVVLKVVEAYQAVLFAERRIAVAEHEQATAEALLEDAKSKVKAGLAVDSDRLAAQVNDSERQQELMTAEGDRDVARATLEAAMGSELATGTKLQPIEAKSFPAGVLGDEIASALRTRPDLKALEQAREAQSAGVKAARADFGPQVSAYGNWEMDRDSFAGSGGNNWVAGVQISLDILPMGKRAKLAQEEAARRKAEAQERSGEQQIRLAVQSAYSQHATAERIVKTAEASSEQAAESLRIVQNRYNAGLATITELLRTEDAQRQSQNDYWRAVYGNTVAYAELMYATGTLTPDAAESLQ